jgi:hypothetical protein
MPDWNPRPTARIGLRLIGIASIASLEPQCQLLRALVRQTSDIMPEQCLLAATCFISASLGMMLLMLGPDLWKPVTVTSQWHGHDIGTDGAEKIAPDGR